MGAETFPEATALYITADGGSSNGTRCRLWKTELQSLANEINMPIEVSHFPPGTSKWSKIERRLFSEISKNWRGKPLETIAAISSPETAVMKKSTPDHISKYLDGAELEMKNSYAEKFHRKVFTFLTMIVAMAFFILLVILLKDNPDVMEKIIYIVGGVVIGAFQLSFSEARN